MVGGGFALLIAIELFMFLVLSCSLIAISAYINSLVCKDYLSLPPTTLPPQKKQKRSQDFFWGGGGGIREQNNYAIKHKVLNSVKHALRKAPAKITLEITYLGNLGEF